MIIFDFTTMSHSTHTYLLTLYVTYQQELAIRGLFSSNGWVFRKDGDGSSMRGSVKDFTEETADEDRNIAPETGYRMDDDSGTSGKDNSNNYCDDKEMDEREILLATETLVSATDKIKNETVTSNSDDLTDPDDDTDEYFPEEANKSRSLRKSTKQAKFSKKLKQDQSVKTVSPRKRQSLVSVSQKEPKMKKHFSAALSQSGSDVKTGEKLSPCQISNSDLGIDADPDRTALEIELQETEDIDHYETVHKSLTPDEQFNPPSDVQETDGFSPSLGCYYCHDCGYTFQLQKWYKIHKWNGKCVYTCEVCSEIFTFRTISSYRTHMKTHKMETEPVDTRFIEVKTINPIVEKPVNNKFLCGFDDCQKKFSTKPNLRRHMKEHEKKAWHKCTKCTSFFSSQENLWKHIELKHSKIYLCDFCGKDFSTTSSLGRHKLLCHCDQTAIIPCNLCSKAFRSTQRLEEHMNSHTGIRPYKCKHCQHGYFRYDTCKRHEKACLIGKGKKPLKKGQNSMSMNIMHDENGFHCNYEDCQKTFSAKYNLTRHMKEHDSEVWHKCTRCSSFFTTPDSLLEHIGQKHSHVFLCDFCGKEFSSSSNLGRHIRHCKSSDVISCSSCPKSFTSLERLQEHMNKHKGFKPYNCKHCRRNFSRYDTCKHHEKMCRDGGVLCRFCGKTFASKTSLRDHIAATHEKINFTCEVCGIHYKYRPSLSRHKLNKGH